MARTEMTMADVPKDWKKLVKAALKAGWTTKTTRGGLLCYSPTDATHSIIISGLHHTQTGKRSLAQKTSEFRQHGVAV